MALTLVICEALSLHVPVLRKFLDLEARERERERRGDVSYNGLTS